MGTSPAPLSQAGFDIRLDWGAGGLADIAVGVEAVVVVDILSFTTAVEVACSRGARVFPSPWKDARAGEMALERGAWLAVGRTESSEESPYSLSPATLRGLARGEKLVLPSPNGAEVALAAAEIDVPVFAGCLRNRRAVAQAVEGRYPLAVIAAGERRGDGSLRPAWEDLVGVGAVVAELAGRRSPEGELAVAAWAAAEGELERLLAECASGRELGDAGYDEDIRMAAEVDVSTCVPMLLEGGFVRVSAP